MEVKVDMLDFGDGFLITTNHCLERALRPCSVQVLEFAHPDQDLAAVLEPPVTLVHIPARTRVETRQQLLDRRRRKMKLKVRELVRKVQRIIARLEHEEADEFADEFEERRPESFTKWSYWAIRRGEDSTLKKFKALAEALTDKDEQLDWRQIAEK